ncbi:hypothetical protein NLI96_g6839 [Meripilus lineatus]|uniref:Uncharacterized protein n=1 Tax=Meripilus lineatus TaxID=2056292 RepID=A0AAD5V524_9APHY|nr:hypothetical protein NLI96_g6839 [Physisporinus lineatus]
MPRIAIHNRVRAALAPKNTNIPDVIDSGVIALSRGNSRSTLQLVPCTTNTQRLVKTSSELVPRQRGNNTPSDVKPSDDLSSGQSPNRNRSQDSSWDKCSEVSPNSEFNNAFVAGASSNSSRDSWDNASVASSEQSSWEFPSVSLTNSSWGYIRTTQQNDPENSWEEAEISVPSVFSQEENPVVEEPSEPQSNDAPYQVDASTSISILDSSDVSLWIRELLCELEISFEDHPHTPDPFITSAAEFPPPVVYEHPTGPCIQSTTCPTCIIARSLPSQFPPNFAYNMRLIPLEIAASRNDIRFRPEGFEIQERTQKPPRWNIRKNVDMSFVDIDRIMGN